MSNDLYLYRRKVNSVGSGAVLASLLNAKQVAENCRKNQPSEGTIINWGRSKMSPWLEGAIANGCRVLNHPDNVKISVDKIKCLRTLTQAGVPTLTYVTDVHLARKLNETHDIIVRKLYKSYGGKGIVFVPRGNPELIEEAPLYTLYVDKIREYRIHVVDGKIIDYVQKKKKGKEKLKKAGLTKADPIIRSNTKGWVFARNDINVSQRALKLAKKTTEVLGLDFVAIDVLEDKSGFYVCETNTAPGISDTNTKEAYHKAFSSMLSKNISPYFKLATEQFITIGEHQ